MKAHFLLLLCLVSSVLLEVLSIDQEEKIEVLPIRVLAPPNPKKRKIIELHEVELSGHPPPFNSHRESGVTKSDLKEGAKNIPEISYSYDPKDWIRTQSTNSSSSDIESSETSHDDRNQHYERHSNSEPRNYDDYTRTDGIYDRDRYASNNTTYYDEKYDRQDVPDPEYDVKSVFPSGENSDLTTRTRSTYSSSSAAPKDQQYTVSTFYYRRHPKKSKSGRTSWKSGSVKEKTYSDDAYAKEAPYSDDAYAKEAPYSDDAYAKEAPYSDDAYAKDAHYSDYAYAKDAHYSDDGYAKEKPYSDYDERDHYSYSKVKNTEQEINDTVRHSDDHDVLDTRARSSGPNTFDWTYNKKGRDFNPGYFRSTYTKSKPSSYLYNPPSSSSYNSPPSSYSYSTPSSSSYKSPPSLYPSAGAPKLPYHPTTDPESFPAAEAAPKLPYNPSSSAGPSQSYPLEKGLSSPYKSPRGPPSSYHSSVGHSPSYHPPVAPPASYHSSIGPLSSYPKSPGFQSFGGLSSHPAPGGPLSSFPVAPKPIAPPQTYKLPLVQTLPITSQKSLPSLPSLPPIKGVASLPQQPLPPLSPHKFLGNLRIYPALIPPIIPHSYRIPLGHTLKSAHGNLPNVLAHHLTAFRQGKVEHQKDIHGNNHFHVHNHLHQHSHNHGHKHGHKHGHLGAYHHPAPFHQGYRSTSYYYYPGSQGYFRYPISYMPKSTGYGFGYGYGDSRYNKGYYPADADSHEHHSGEKSIESHSAKHGNSHGSSHEHKDDNSHEHHHDSDYHRDHENVHHRGHSKAQQDDHSKHHDKHLDNKDPKNPNLIDTEGKFDLENYKGQIFHHHIPMSDPYSEQAGRQLIANIVRDPLKMVHSYDPNLQPRHPSGKTPTTSLSTNLSPRYPHKNETPRYLHANQRPQHPQYPPTNMTPQYRYPAVNLTPRYPPPRHTMQRYPNRFGYRTWW